MKQMMAAQGLVVGLVQARHGAISEVHLELDRLAAFRRRLAATVGAP